MRKPLLGLTLALAAGCGDGAPASAPTDSAALRSRLSIDARRSILITDREVLDATRNLGDRRFSMRRVLDQLASESGHAELDGLALFRQMWDTQNPAPGYTGRGAHCDDRAPMINGQPLICRPLDGLQAKDETGAVLDGYFPIALVNRFDLASPDGKSCGEYRIVYAKGPELPGRSLVIFEAALENPHPEQGLAACTPVQKMWASLSDEGRTPAQRAAMLDEFFFDGLGDFAPVMRVAAFEMNAEVSGQIRTNTFMDKPWSLRELKLAQRCTGVACDLEMVPVTVKANPYGKLFAGSDGVSMAFQAEFVDNVERLAVRDLAGIGYARADDSYNAAESTDNYNDDFVSWFAKEQSGFRGALQARLDAMGSSLTPDHIVRRARTQSCVGCHQRAVNADLGDGLRWPRSLGFVHVSETLENGPEGQRYQISPALTDVLLPARKALIEDFLGMGAAATIARNARFQEGPKQTLSGAVH